ncbi:MAG: type II secretion system protein [Planctomycetes bacterium]|nr:type II secretion system protein [Planctomycetota bacterium]
MRFHLLHSRKPRSSSAFTLVELTVVIGILCVAVGLFAQTMVASAKMDPVAEESRLASEGARMQLEDMRACSFDELFRRYNADPADDPGGPGTAPGAWFAIEGLHAPAGVAGVGHVIFPTVAGALTESVQDDLLGMPHDLNGDGVIDSIDHATDAIILPVRIQLEWSSRSGRQGKRKLLFYDMFARL